MAFGGLKKVLFLWCNSGDADAIVPVTSTRYSINALNLSTLSPYGPWYIDGQVINKQTQLRKVRIHCLDIVRKPF